VTVAPRNLDALTAEALHDDFDTAKYTARAQQALNEALGRVGRRVDSLQRRATATISVVGATDTYTLPADFVRLVSLRDAGQRRVLTETLNTEIDELPASHGVPAYYAVDGSSLLLWPTPVSTETLTLRYWATPAAMAAGTDVPAIPADYVDLLVTYTRSKLFRWEDDKQMADGLMADFERDLGIARTDLQNTSRTTGRRTPGMYAGMGNASPNFTRP
jgi:hypothetical protein